MKKILILLLLIPSVASASLSSDLNSILDWFYTGEDNTEAFDPSFEYGETAPEYEIPEIIIPEDPTMQDLVEFRKQVFTEESLLEEIESELRLAEQSEENSGVNAAEVENELFLLENQKEDFQDELKRMEQNIAYTEKKITNLTREKTKLRASFEIAREDFERFMTKRYIRKSFFGGSRGLNAFRWLFSDKNASTLLEDEKREQQKEAQKQGFLKSLWGIKTQIDQKEKEMAFQYARFNRLNRDLQRRYGHLEEMTTDREQKMHDLFAGKQAAEQTIQTLRARQAETTLRLQNLRSALEKIEDSITLRDPGALENLNSDRPFIWPLEGTIEITATYQDPEYERQLGRVHEGIDFYASQGSTVRAAADGVVDSVENGGFGYSFITVKHSDNLFSLYGHVSKILVTEGQAVLQGERIAESGGTAGTEGAGYWTTGPHLHFAAYNTQGFIDPTPLLPEATPVSSAR